MSGSRYPAWMSLAAWLGAGAVRLMGATWRIERVGVLERDAALTGGQRCIFAFWHGRMLPLVFVHRGQGSAVLVSEHRDGELIRRVIGHLGFVTARGSSTRGGEAGLREMLKFADEGRFLGLTPDGPRGPAERVKAGLVYLAARTGLPVVPVTMASPSAWVMGSWDRFRVPRPFSRVAVAYGSPLKVPPKPGREEVEAWCGRIEAALRELTARTMARVGERA